MNKKAQKVLGWEIPMWGIRFFGIALIAFFVWLIMWSFFSKQVDIRSTEALLLSKRITGCFGPIVEPEKFNKENLMECTGLIQTKEIYINVTLRSLESSFNQSLGVGDPTLRIICKMQKLGKKQRWPPACLEQTFYVLLKKEDGKEMARLDMSIGIKKFDKNVS